MIRVRIIVNLTCETSGYFFNYFDRLFSDYINCLDLTLIQL